jgi:hypothetical protein
MVGNVSHDPHASDALGLMAIAYRSPKELARFYAPINYPKMSVA